MSGAQLADIVGNGKGGIGGAVEQSTGSLNVQRTDDPRFADVFDPVLIDETNLSVATHHFPDVNGVAQLGFGPLSFQGRVRSGTAGETLIVTIEGTNGVDYGSGEEWIDIVGPFTDETGTSPLSSPLASVTNASDSFAVYIDYYPYKKWRLKVVVTGTTSDNDVFVASYQRGV